MCCPVAQEHDLSQGSSGTGDAQAANNTSSSGNPSNNTNTLSNNNLCAKISSSPYSYPTLLKGAQVRS